MSCSVLICVADAFLGVEFCSNLEGLNLNLDGDVV